MAVGSLVLILLITLVNAFPAKNQTSKIQDYSNGTDFTLGSNYSAPFMQGLIDQGGGCCDPGCFVNCSMANPGGLDVFHNRGLKVTNSFQTTMHMTTYAMKARHPHNSIRHGVKLMPTMMIIFSVDLVGHYSLGLNLAHTVIAIRSKQRDSAAGMLKARPQAFGNQL